MSTKTTVKIEMRNVDRALAPAILSRLLGFLPQRGDNVIFEMTPEERDVVIAAMMSASEASSG